MRDFEEVRGQEAGVYCEARLRIIIAHQTVNTYKEQDRETNVFRPVLYPIYYELIRQLSLHPQIMPVNENRVPHSKWDRSYWGTRQQGDGEKNMLNDYVDAIDIDNLRVKILFPNC
jgi:hypothetical protein